MAANAPAAPLVAVIGATGTGKSKLAVAIASKFNGEIINGDAMQMYRGLPIITNQIPEHEREGIPHHLLGNVGLEEEPWNVGRFSTECRKVIRDIRSRGKLPVLVGGTHYYTQAVLFKQSVLEGRDRDEEEDNPTAGEDRASAIAVEQSTRVDDPILEASAEEMLARLREVDPVMANRWHPNDIRKIRRSLEIWLQTGRKASDIYQEQKLAKIKLRPETGAQPPPFLLFWLHTPTEALDPRLNRRVDSMLEDGLLEEAKSLYDFVNTTTLPVDKTSGIWVSIGYKEFESYIAALQSGTSSHEQLDAMKSEAIERTQVSTRQYARRQERWIKIKLGNALAEHGALSRLFVLDTSEVSQDRWDVNVTTPAFRNVKALLNGEALDDPKTVSPLAQHLLNSVQSVGQDDEIVQTNTCEACNKVLATQKQWEDHLTSKGHKAVLKARAKRDKGIPGPAEREARRQEREMKRANKLAADKGESVSQ